MSNTATKMQMTVLNLISNTSGVYKNDFRSNNLSKKKERIKLLKVPFFMYCIARPPWSSEMVSVLPSLNRGIVEKLSALWEARLWPLVTLAS